MIENRGLIEFDDIQKANETIRTTDIKGKEYAEVNQRIKAFRTVYPQGNIKTTLVSNENGVCIFKAEVFDNDCYMLATGHAYEKEGSTFINKTSYIENCETSAVGRALGMCGFGIDTSVASAEEVSNAQLQQEAEKVIDQIKVKALLQSIANNNISEEALAGVLNEYGYDEVSKIKIKHFGEIVNKLRAIKEG